MTGYEKLQVAEFGYDNPYAVSIGKRSHYSRVVITG